MRLAELDDLQGVGFQRIESYLTSVLAEMARLPVIEDNRACASPIGSPLDIATKTFSLIMGRKFCYLGRRRAEAYRRDVIPLLIRRIQSGEPLRFFYDIGPGYHASLRAGRQPLNYRVGLSELLIIRQITAVCSSIAKFYPSGARFWLVIDNLCGFRTNDIPVYLTEQYVTELRALIRATNVSETIELLVESEQFCLEDYDRLLDSVEPQPPKSQPSSSEIENVARFLGRCCSPIEAAERIENYRRASIVTDTLLGEHIRDVHMTQRATGATLAFRPYPGGDQRTQAGELSLTGSANGRVRPLLITSTNVDKYELHRFEFPDLLPCPIQHITYAWPKSV